MLQCAVPTENELTVYLRDLVATNRAFLSDHRYDPSEIYSDDLLEELQKVPNPQKEPLEFIDHYLSILDEFGPWAADRAALTLLMQIEKAKVKTPYERNFLLLCMVSTTFIQIRAYCESVFQQLPTDRERIETYSSPKVLRLLEVLRAFAPPKKPDASNASGKPVPAAVSPCNELNTLVSEEIRSVSEEISGEQDTKLNSSKKNQINSLDDPTVNDVGATTKAEPTPNAQSHSNVRGFRHRKPFQPRPPRVPPNQYDPDALCGIIFCNSNVIAKVLYSLVYEASKSDPQLEYIMAQFTVDRLADPLTETKQAETEHRKQEEVLKRFRMHACNLLIGTAVLEEGIELPKCNLVVRWDAPTTYRSYVQCKGRARAHQAYHVIMVAPTRRGVDEMRLDWADRMPDRSHVLVCAPNQSFVDAVLNDTKWDDVKSSTSESSEEEKVPRYNGHVQAFIQELKMEMNGITEIWDDDDVVDIKELIAKYECYVDEQTARDEVSKIIAQNNDLKRQFVVNRITDEMVERLAQYREIEKVRIT